MKKRFLVGLEIFVATIAVIGATVFAASAGSESDPLVSKSYVDDKINQVISMINTGTSTAVVDSVGSSYEPVYASVGQTVIGGEGTEIILRAGQGTVVISGADGIVDATTGQNLTSGKAASKNHIMIVPRNDGRGIKVTEAAWFLIKGEYSIK
ncbi:MAG: hypothetical protein ACI4VF_04980 [Lachnospirales bacterium]